MTKTLGQMTPAERKAAVKRAVSKLQAELNNPAVKAAIGKVLSDFDAEHAPKLFYIRYMGFDAQAHYWGDVIGWTQDPKQAVRFSTAEEAGTYADKTLPEDDGFTIVKADPAKLKALGII